MTKGFCRLSVYTSIEFVRYTRKIDTYENEERNYIFIQSFIEKALFSGLYTKYNLLLILLVSVRMITGGAMQ